MLCHHVFDNNATFLLLLHHARVLGHCGIESFAAVYVIKTFLQFIFFMLCDRVFDNNATFLLLLHHAC